MDVVDEGDEILKEWEAHMSDFEPKDLFSFELRPRTNQVIFLQSVIFNFVQIFYENVSKVPAYIRGAFFVSIDKKTQIDFEVKIISN